MAADGGHGFDEGLAVIGRVDADGGDSEDLRALLGELAGRAGRPVRGVRVTTMRRPKRGRCSNQLSLGRRVTTPPTTATAGALKFCSATTAAMVARVLSMDCCWPVVPSGPCRRGWWAEAAFDQGWGERANALDAHEYDLGAGHLGELGVVEGVLVLGGVFMAGDDGELAAGRGG